LTLYHLCVTIKAEVGEVMANGYIESIAKVEEFLAKVKQVLCADSFDIRTDLDVLLSPVSGTTGYRNAETLVELGFNNSDIRNVLLSLTAQDYSETLIDACDPTLPAFRVFGKDINKKEVYIKAKIRDRGNKQVFCISFHFSLYPISKPFVI